MKANFAACCNIALGNEGGYTNNPNDPGGPTNRGITLATAKALGLDGNHDGVVDIVDIKSLSELDARAVYKAEYWDKCSCDALPLGLDLSVFDCAINSGVHEAGLILQHAVYTIDKDLLIDGVIGPKTLALVSTLPIGALINDYAYIRIEFLKSLPTWTIFGPGWQSRVNTVFADSEDMAKLTAKPSTTTHKKETFMDWLNSSVIQALTRNIAQWLAGILATYGLIDSSQTATAGAIILGLATAAWSFVAAHTSHKAVAVANAVNNGAPTTTVSTLAAKV